MLSSLTWAWDACLKFSFWGRNHQDSTVSLSSSSNHILNEISVSWGINNGNFIFFSLKLPQRNINSDSLLSRSFHSVHNPSIFEASLVCIVGLFLKFFKYSFFNTSTQINHMSSCCRFTGINMAYNDHINVILLSSHC